MNFHSVGNSFEKVFVETEDAPKTFSDILADEHITSPDGLKRPFTGTTKPKQRFVESVRRMALPKMQGVVHNVMKRSVTMARRDKSRVEEAEHSNDDNLSQTVRSESPSSFTSMTITPPPSSSELTRRATTSSTNSTTIDK